MHDARGESSEETLAAWEEGAARVSGGAAGRPGAVRVGSRFVLHMYDDFRHMRSISLS